MCACIWVDALRKQLEQVARFRVAKAIETVRNTYGAKDGAAAEMRQVMTELLGISRLQ